MRLRDVTLDDRALWVRLRCDPVMWIELGGPQSPESIPSRAFVRAGGFDVVACAGCGRRLRLLAVIELHNFPLTVIPSGGHPPPGAPVSHRTR